jgi:hypothetical protein
VRKRTRRKPTAREERFAGENPLENNWLHPLLSLWRRYRLNRSSCRLLHRHRVASCVAGLTTCLGLGWAPVGGLFRWPNLDHVASYLDVRSDTIVRHGGQPIAQRDRWANGKHFSFFICCTCSSSYAVSLLLLFRCIALLHIFLCMFVALAFCVCNYNAIFLMKYCFCAIELFLRITQMTEL